MIDDGGPSESVRMWKELKKGGRKEKKLSQEIPMPEKDGKTKGL